MPAALDKVVAFLREQIGGKLPTAIGHRVVHGGPDYSEPTVVTDARCSTGSSASFRSLRCTSPTILRPIRAILERQPHLLQVACFDTAFHRGHPEVADRFAIPEELYAEGVRRYGFHGLSYEYIAQTARRGRARNRRGPGRRRASRQRRVHVRDRRRQERRKHDGLHGARRSAHGHAAGPARCRRCALPDEREGDEREGDRALSLQRLRAQGPFGHQQRRAGAARERGSRAPSWRSTTSSTGSRSSPGMLAAAMGGIDAFVFTAGIGENAPAIREAVMRRLSWLGLELATSGERQGRAAASRASGHASPATSSRPTRS